MNNIFNFNEIRRLGAAAEKRRPVLGCLHIEKGRATFTDSTYLISMGGFEKSPDGLIKLSDYSSDISLDTYPSVKGIIANRFAQVTFEQRIIEGKIGFVYKNKDGVEECYLAQATINQVQKLIASKKYNATIENIKVYSGVARLDIDEDNFIIFTAHRMPKPQEPADTPDDVDDPEDPVYE